MEILLNIHKYYGEAMQLVPIVVIIMFALRNKTPFQRVAPILLDINILFGFIGYYLLMQAGAAKPVSIWHPILMIAAAVIAHMVAKKESKQLVLGAWGIVLVLIVVAILIAKGIIPL